MTVACRAHMRREVGREAGPGAEELGPLAIAECNKRNGVGERFDCDRYRSPPRPQSGSLAVPRARSLRLATSTLGSVVAAAQCRRRALPPAAKVMAVTAAAGSLLLLPRRRQYYATVLRVTRAGGVVEPRRRGEDSGISNAKRHQ
jgi:hypothetical protein